MTGKLKAFASFWYDFLIGDDWRVAVGVVARAGGHRRREPDERVVLVDRAGCRCAAAPRHRVAGDAFPRYP